MRARRREAAFFLILALGLAGCGKEAEPEPEKTISNRKKLQVIGQNLPSVARLNPNTDFYGLWQYLVSMELESGRWPASLDDLVKAGYQKDGGGPVLNLI